LTRVLLSTDDPQIAELAATWEIEAPFLRPAHLAEDDTPMLPVLLHALDWLSENGQPLPDIVVLLQPTSPLRRAEHINAALDLLQSSDADTVVTVVEVPHNFTPSSLMRLEDGYLHQYGDGDAPLRRQEKAKLYARNGPAVLAVRRKVLEGGKLYGEKVLPLVMSRAESVDIDEPADLALAEFWLRRRGK